MFVYGFKEIFDKVADYNGRIERLIRERRNYIDSVMEEISPFKIGDEYVYVKTGERTKVRHIYRMSSVGDRGEYFDDSIFDIHAEFENGDNTSRYEYEWNCPYVKAEDYDNKTAVYYEKLEDLAKNN